MRLSEFRRAGHTPTLVASLLHFDVSFLCWVLLGALSIPISASLGLSDGQTGLMVAVPALSAAVFRVTIGQLVDRIGPRRIGIGMLIVGFVPLLLGWLWGTSFPAVLLIGVLLGVAGASFVVSLPMASRWYPPKYQGLAMGIAGAGNSGTVIATFFAPRLAEHCAAVDPSTGKRVPVAQCAPADVAGWFTWHEVFALAMIPVALVLVTFAVFAREAPAAGGSGASAAVPFTTLIRDRDVWRLCGFYAVTFGFFLGLTTFGPKYLNSEYTVSQVTAGTWIAVGALGGSLMRPLGGTLADRIGGTRVLLTVYAVATVLFAGLALTRTALGIELLLVLTIATLGFGNGAVFQLVGLRYSGRHVGAVTGLVGACGGLGGFLLPILLGYGKDLTGSFAAPLGLVAVLALTALIGMAISRAHWRRGWTTATESGVRI